MSYLKKLWVLLLVIGTMSACDEEVDPDTYDIPTTYNFTNVSYQGQTDRLNMLAEMTTYMKTGNTFGTTLDAQKLKDMYANENSAFTDADLNSSTKQLKSKTFELDQTMFEGYMDALATASQSATAGSNGTAGVVESNDGSKKYLLDENGIEYTQLIEKGLMGAVFYYQAAAVYLSDDRMNVDNTTVTAGEGTAMEHHWDEAFGYFGVPIDFPTTTSSARFWGKYCNDRDDILGLNAKLMGALLKGRAAISNDDLTTRDEARTEVRQYWEQVSAATAIHYLNGAKADFADDALRNHQLSEFIAFLESLKYNPDKTITNAQITTVRDYIGTNLYDVTIADINSAIDELATIYGWTDIKSTL